MESEGGRRGEGKRRGGEKEEGEKGRYAQVRRCGDLRGARRRSGVRLKQLE